ncbi:MAG: DUF4870 domain-containing protein [Verrucomicrobiota bacterium]
MDNIPPPPVPDPITPQPNSDDKIWIIFCHLSLLLGIGFLLPLVVYLVKKEDSPATAEHAREALNFHISVYLYGFICFLLIFVAIGLVLLPLLGLASAVLAIVAAIKASEGKPYRYPLTIRLV